MNTIDKYEYLTGEKMLPSHQRRVIEQPKVTSSPLQKALENKRKQLKIKEKNKYKQLKSMENNWLNVFNSFVSKNDYDSENDCDSKDEYILILKEKEIR